MLDLNDSYAALRGSAGVYPMTGSLLRLSGAQRQGMLSWLLARTTEYSHPDTSEWSLVLDKTGRPAGTALVLLGETEDLLLLDAAAGWLDAACGAAPEQVHERVEVTPAEGFAIAIEGPRSWEVVEPLIDQPISDLLLNEVIGTTVGGRPVRLARTGTTSEFGYVVIGSGSIEAAMGVLAARAAELGGGVIDPQALVRVHVETNHPIIPEQTRGLSITESGVSWLMSLTRDDAFYGDAALGVPAGTRRLVAAYARGQDFPASGTSVFDEDNAVGTVQVAAPAAGCGDGIGLLLLDNPYCVPGLSLMTGDGQVLETVSRPAVTPLSWVRTIGVRP